MNKETSRIEAFSDGIFAVAITLLALDIGVDIKGIEAHHRLEATTAKELLGQLTNLWPKIFAYFNSFASLLLIWMSHHQLFKLLRTTNNKLILANGLLLLAVALVPFPTKTLGEFLGSDAQKTAIVFYTGYSVVVAVLYLLVMAAAKSKAKNLFLPNVSVKGVQTISKGLETGFFLCVMIFVISLFAPVVGLCLHFCMWIYWAVTAKDNETDH
ncbi:TMEM175 family protein [Mucilaginibacter sp.]|uniref:TMEM175 family protein n=1 Tax=Mucilaginibacter sp. TaxID=1882438 RepID=UPI003B00E1B0